MLIVFNDSVISSYSLTAKDLNLDSGETFIFPRGLPVKVSDEAGKKILELPGFSLADETPAELPLGPPADDNPPAPEEGGKPKKASGTPPPGDN